MLPPGAISLQVAIPDGLFNAAYQKPAYADSVLSNAISCGSASGDCLPALATDGYSGNHHRWISSPDRPDHWIGVDLQDDFWVTTVNVFAGVTPPATTPSSRTIPSAPTPLSTGPGSRTPARARST